MDVSLEQQSLLGIIQDAGRALSNKSTLPILNGLLLDANKETLTAYSTDLEISIKSHTKALVNKPGKTVVYGSLLVDLIKNLEQGKINLILDQEKNRLVIKSNQSQFEINTLPVDDYPPFPETEEGKSLKITNKELSEALRQVAISISRDETRPTLTGLYLNLEKEKTRVVATDSYRLSVKEIKTTPKGSEGSLLMPRRAIEELYKTLRKEGGAKITFSDKQVAVESGPCVFISRLMGGAYPNFEQLLPQKHEVEVLIDKEDLLQATKRMALVSPSTPVFLQIKGETLIVSNKSTDVGSGREKIKIKKATKNVEVAFNSKYLIEGLGVIGDQEITLQLTDSFQPGLIRGTKTKDYLYLIMPVRLN